MATWMTVVGMSEYGLLSGAWGLEWVCMIVCLCVGVEVCDVRDLYLSRWRVLESDRLE